MEKMTEEHLVAALLEYGDKLNPKPEVVRSEEDSAPGITFKEFIESLSFGNQKQDRTD